ncbi:MAG TPA: hypothetical protein VNZ64_05060 [Candidatus Acidoferrum sp.]|jgi:hypothetical protein|nr:hypothetical protein [Candidatus Acidoferrum sp.]
MGILKLFAKASPDVQRLPHGSVTLDRDANIIATTIPSAFGPEMLQEIGTHILGLFREARKAQMPLTELNLHFASLQITAREMRGGAVVFLKPKDLFKASPKN